MLAGPWVNYNLSFLNKFTGAKSKLIDAFKRAWWCSFSSAECNQFWKQLLFFLFFVNVYQKWMIDFYDTHLSPRCAAPSLSHPIITVLMTYPVVFQGGWHSSSLCVSLSSALKERGARRSLKAVGSHRVLDPQCHISLYKETSCMRHLQEGW